MDSPEYDLSACKEMVIPAGVELNTGTHEDGERVEFTVPVKVRVLGGEMDGALPVAIEGQNFGMMFYHQHVLRTPGGE